MNLIRMATIVVWLFLPPLGQVSTLRVVSAAPTGELVRIEDAGEVRIAFSEPMVPLGAPPLTTAPPWLEMVPASPGTFYWSGTRTLIFSPELQHPLPFATTFTIRVAATAASVSGATLATPFELTFTTPRPRLMDVQWRRKTGRFDAPVVLELLFNQPMNPDAVLPHLNVSLRPHGWSAPTLSSAARQRLARIDRTGLAQFDAKVARVRAATLKSDRYDMRTSDARPWREPLPHPDRVVMLETIGAPPTSVLLDLALDASLRGLQGPEPHPAQSSVVALDRAFFVEGTTCDSPCDPDRGISMKLAAPVASGMLSKALAITDITEQSRVRRVEAGTPAFFQDAREISFIGLGYDGPRPARKWELRISSDLQSLDGQTLGYPWLGFIETSRGAPFVGIDGSVWEASAGTSLPVTVRNVRSWTQEIGGVTPSEIVPRLQELASRKGFGGLAQRSTRRLPATRDAVAIHNLDVKSVLGPRGTGIVTTAVLPHDVVPGSVRALDSLLDRRVIQVTNLGITVKDGPLSTLVLVTRLDSGVAVPGASVAIVDTANRMIWRGTTDGDGVASGPGLPVHTDSSREDARYVVTAEKNGDTAFIPTTEHEDVEELDRYGTPAFRLQAVAFTDRGVYRPGDEIQFKAIVRETVEDGLRSLPAKTSLTVTIRDSRGDDIDERQIVTTEWSSVDWTWRVPARAPLGDYLIYLTRADAAGDADYRAAAGTFLVAAYRRPDIRVETALTADPPILGTPLRGRAGAQYLFGAAVADAAVRWSLFRRPTQSPPATVLERYPEDRYIVGYEFPWWLEGDSEAPFGKEERLGRDGVIAVDLPTTANENGSAYAFIFEADVEDAAQQHIANNTQIVLHPASIYVAMSRLPMFVDASKGQRVTVATVDLSGRSVANTPVTMVLMREQWVEERSSETGVLRWTTRETQVGQWTLQTTSGEVPLAFDLVDGGSYILRATARDTEGRLTRTEARFYAFGGSLTTWRGGLQHRLTLVPERTTWKPGERARILVQSPWPQATALVTLEREGIRRHQTVAIRSTQDTVDVPITAADSPGLYVSVMLIKGRTSATLDADDSDPGKPSYALGYARLDVEDPSKRLRVEVTSDKTEYRPGASTTISARVTAPDGRPASTEVTLWAVDHGLLSLTNYTMPDLYEQMRGHRPLLVRTADSRRYLIGRGPMSPPTPEKGEEFEFVQVSAGERSQPGTLSEHGVEVRTDFRPLVFWLGSVATDETGRATTTVTLPDSLTTYRVMAVAADRDSRFGSGQVELRVNKPLTLLPALPRFLNAGDRASVGAVVSSQRASSSHAVVTIESLGPSTLRVDGNARQSVSVPPGASVPVRFSVVAQTSGTTRVRMTVTLDDETDAFEVPLDVTEQVRLQTSGAYGETTGTAIERLMLPSTVVAGAGGLTVDLSSSALVGLGESARYLDEYQYGCAEQKASRALALVFAAELGAAFTLSTTTPAEYRQAAATAVSDLHRFQCDNGGFALWEGECRTQSVYLTAYVLHALKVADRAQLGTDSNVTDMALAYLESQLPVLKASTNHWPVASTAQAFAVKVLAEYGRKPDVQIARLVETADRLTIVALSYLADALHATSDRGPGYQDLVRRLLNAVRVDADRAHVEEIDESTLGWLWLTNVNATAIVLDGLSRRQDDVTLVAPMVRWLMAARSNGRWGSTHENALALEALVAYYRAFESGTGAMIATVNVGSTTLAKAAFPAGSIVAHRVSVPTAELVKVAPASNTEVAVSRVGEGRLYYTARLQYATPESPEAIDRGFAISRRYERYVDGKTEGPQTTFSAGDLVRVTVSVTVRGEARYLALTDPLPAGFEPVETRFATTARSAMSDAARTSEPWRAWFESNGFEHIERHDDRIVAFATRLLSGAHELTYLARATTAGVFSASGARAEAMYAPEVEGRSAAATMTVLPK